MQISSQGTPIGRNFPVVLADSIFEAAFQDPLIGHPMFLTTV